MAKATNTIVVHGLSFEEVCITAEIKSRTAAYKGCAVHVNTRINKEGVGVKSKKRMFSVYWYLSDWYDADCTMATFVNGVETT